MRRRPSSRRGRRGLFGQSSAAPRLSRPRHRRFKVPGRHRLEQVADSGVQFAWIRRAKAATASISDSRPTGKAPRRRASRTSPITSSIGAGPDGGDGQLRAERAGRIGRSAARARRRGDADLKTCKIHLTQDGAIAQMKVMLDEMERTTASGRSSTRPSTSTRRSSPTAPSWTTRSGCARRSITRRQDMDRDPGRSGSTSRTHTSPGSAQGRPQRSTDQGPMDGLPGGSRRPPRPAEGHREQIGGRPRRPAPQTSPYDGGDAPSLSPPRGPRRGPGRGARDAALPPDRVTVSADASGQ